MRVDSCIFQDCAICQTKLSTQRCTCGKFVVVAAVVHGESTAALYIDDTLYHRIIQCQFSAIFNDDANAAQDLHIGQCQVASFRNIQGLRNVSTHYLFPRKIITQISVSSAHMRSEPCFQVFRNTNAFCFTIHIASKVFDCPWFHDIPCIQTAFILFEVICYQSVCQSFLSGVYMER